MAAIDIRSSDEVCIDKIVFADENDYDYYGLFLANTPTSVVVVDETDREIKIRNEDVENLIKALQKAVELGWTK